MSKIDAQRRTAPAAGAACQNMSDAPLLAMWGEYVRINEEQDALAHSTQGNMTPEQDARYQALDQRAIELHNKIGSTPATTLSGLSAKLRCLAEFGIDMEDGKTAARAPIIPAYNDSHNCGQPEAFAALRIARELEAVIRFQSSERAAWDALVADHAIKKAAADGYERRERVPAIKENIAGQLADEELAPFNAEGERLDAEEYAALCAVLETRAPDYGALAAKVAIIDSFNDAEMTWFWFKELAADARQLRQIGAVPNAAALANDEHLVDLFRQWQAAINVYNAKERDLPGRNAEDDAASEAYMSLEARIMALPAYGARGMAVKAAIIGIAEHGKAPPSGNAAQFYVPLAEQDHPARQMMSLLRDAQLALPEVAIFAPECAHAASKARKDA